MQVTLNQDLVDAKMGEDELMALVESWLKGAVSSEALVENLISGEILPRGTDREAEATRLEGILNEAADRRQEFGQQLSGGEDEQGEDELT